MSMVRSMLGSEEHMFNSRLEQRHATKAAPRPIYLVVGHDFTLVLAFQFLTSCLASLESQDQCHLTTLMAAPSVSLPGHLGLHRREEATCLRHLLWLAGVEEVVISVQGLGKFRVQVYRAWGSGVWC